MPLKKLELRPGINKENTRFTNQNGWYDCDRVRFRQGKPQSMLGSTRISSNTFSGVCRSLWSWVTLSFENFTGVGTNLKYYVESGGEYNDITPIRATTSAGDVTFAATDTSSTLVVTDTAHGAITNDYVTFSGSTTLGGVVTAAVLDQEYQIDLVVNANSYNITAKDTAGTTVTANASDTGNGGTVTGVYQVLTGPSVNIPRTGWGSATYGAGTYGVGLSGSNLTALRIWNHSNFGEDLIIAPNGEGIYYWDASAGLAANRAVNISTLTGASDTPTVQNFILVSDVSRFVFAFGANELGTSTQNPLHVRWSDQESAAIWTPTNLNQAGGISLSKGTKIVTAIQARLEILVWTDLALYSFQYVGPDIVWSTQILGDNMSITSQNAAVYSGGVTYWMGLEDFYKYDGVVQTLRCDIKQYIFDDINKDQYAQVFTGANEAFNEVWWFYCSASSTTIDKYAVYNYGEDIWYHGSLARTAWLSAGANGSILAATYIYNLVEQEIAVDDNINGTVTAIPSYITSSIIPLNETNNMSFVRRVLPDLSFTGSTNLSPSATLTLTPFKNIGAGYKSPASESGTNTGTVTRSSSSPVEVFTEQIYVRVRGRSVELKLASTDVGVHWQLGTPLVEVRPDGGR